MSLSRFGSPIVFVFAPLLSVFFLFQPASAQTSPKANSSTDRPIYVGLIEDDRRELALLASNGQPVPGQKGIDDPVPGRTVTPYFMKDSSGWKLVQQLNEKTNWTVAFDGRKIGEVSSELIPESKARARDVPGPSCVHAILTSPIKIPSVGLAKDGFGDNFGAAKRRPLVVVSRANFSDPDQWKRKPLPDELSEKVRAVFRSTFKHIRYCDSSGEPQSTDSKIPDSGIAVLKAYGSNKGAFLIETRLVNHRCVFNQNKAQFQLLEGVQWYYMTPSGELSFLARDWDLVDAGDYDGDGNSEVLFYVAESEDDIMVQTAGFVLFYDDFRHHVTFAWSEMPSEQEKSPSQ